VRADPRAGPSWPRPREIGHRARDSHGTQLALVLDANLEKENVVTPEEVAAIQNAFTVSLEPVMVELRGIHGVLEEHSKLLADHSR